MHMHRGLPRPPVFQTIRLHRFDLRSHGYQHNFRVTDLPTNLFVETHIVINIPEDHLKMFGVHIYELQLPSVIAMGDSAEILPLLRNMHHYSIKY